MTVRQLVTRAPTRIDFGGGWTDVPPFSEREGGFVCNLAIARYATVELRDEPASAAEPRSPELTPALVRAALNRSRMTGIAATLASDFPVGAGLGGSSAAGVALAGAIAAWQAERPARSELAERSRAVEVEELGIAGGRQDHYAAAYGGALGLEFGSDGTRVDPLPLPSPLTASLERRCLLLYTGQSRISGDTIRAVLGAYERRDIRVLGALGRMREIARQEADALARGDIDELGRLVGEQWTHQRALHPAITTPRIDAIVERAARGAALGAKALGASGGGCVLVVAREDNHEALRRDLAPLAELLSFAIDVAGVTVLEDTRAPA